MCSVFVNYRFGIRMAYLASFISMLLLLREPVFMYYRVIHRCFYSLDQSIISMIVPFVSVVIALHIPVKSNLE